MKNLFKISIKLASLAYYDSEYIKKEIEILGLQNFEFLENKETDTQLFICNNSEFVFVSVRGTSTFSDWMTNLKTEFILFPYGMIHKGFWRDAESIYTEVSCSLIKHILVERKLVLTGHSQGAAVACALSLKLHPTYKLHSIIHFGCPRIVDRKAALKITELLPSVYHRFVNNNDLITRVPPRAAGYSHFGKIHYFLRNGKYSDSIKSWYKFLDRFVGKFNVGGEYVFDDLNDHMQENYYELIYNTWKEEIA